ncbi:MAG: hypothetical protein LBQ55_11225 [Treponema sp.]|jgi:hypothetical protein|nr:hypothetical protein [Treponema sp.]
MKLLFTLFALGLVSAAAPSCSREGVSSVGREDPFVLDIGLLEDQVDLYNLEGDRSMRKTRIAMRDGFFYISDGNGKKITRYTSYGDLLFMIYNEETNPEPMTLRTNVEENGMVTRWAFSYPLQEPGEITVDSRKHIYAEDRLPYERHGFDPENKALLDRVVLHFDQDGHFIEYLGQEGLGGSPFPRIEGLYTSVRDEIAVVCRLAEGWNVYWFDAAGTLLYLIKLRNDSLPLRDNQPMVPSIDGIAAAPDERKLYIKVDYFHTIYDEGGASIGIEPNSSMIWIMDAETGASVGSMDVPFFDYTFTENDRRVTEHLLYSMLGIIRNGRVFLTFPVDGGYSVLVLTDAGRQRRGFIQVKADELEYNTFDLSEDGVLSGLLASSLQVKLVWWRTDELMGILSP